MMLALTLVLLTAAREAAGSSPSMGTALGPCSAPSAKGWAWDQAGTKQITAKDGGGSSSAAAALCLQAASAAASV